MPPQATLSQAKLLVEEPSVMSLQDVKAAGRLIPLCAISIDIDTASFSMGPHCQQPRMYNHI